MNSQQWEYAILTGNFYCIFLQILPKRWHSKAKRLWCFQNYFNTLNIECARALRSCIILYTIHCMLITNLLHPEYQTHREFITHGSFLKVQITIFLVNDSNNKLIIFPTHSEYFILPRVFRFYLYIPPYCRFSHCLRHVPPLLLEPP